MYPQDKDSSTASLARIASALEQIADSLKVDNHGNVVTGQLTTVLDRYSIESECPKCQTLHDGPCPNDNDIKERAMQSWLRSGKPLGPLCAHCQGYETLHEPGCTLNVGQTATKETAYQPHVNVAVGGCYCAFCGPINSCIAQQTARENEAFCKARGKELEKTENTDA